MELRGLETSASICSPNHSEKKHDCVTGCSQEGGPKQRFVMGSRAQGVQEILEKKYIGCLHPHKSELGDKTHGAGPFRAVLYSNSCAANL